MRAPKVWKLLEVDRPEAEKLARELGCSPVLSQLLVNRGIHDIEEAKRFLHASLDGLHDPALLPGISEAAARIHQAHRERRRICIYGDYDADGVTGTTILWRCLQLIGADCTFHIPHRMEEGYGLNARTLESLAKDGNKVVVTVDCGITSVAEAETARQLGLELIITDHHLFRKDLASGEIRLPNADVLVHPQLPGSRYPFPDLSGAGVAFKLAWAICQAVCQAQKVSEAMKQFLIESVTLAALGTVADVVPLRGENRIFVRHGLKSLRDAPSLGLKALMEAAEIAEGKELNSEHIGFQLAPRINAAGRLGQARLAVELLAATSPQRAKDLARYLNEQNGIRQTIERRIAHEAREMVEAQFDPASNSAFVLSNPEWHPGVIGIVAGRLVEHYARPVLMISQKEEPGQGSGRSVEGFHLQEALTACGSHLVSHGGHAMAAGFRVLPDRVDALREAFCAHAASVRNGKAFEHTLLIDAEVPLSAMTTGLLKGIAMLQPHGSGNRRPLFMAGGLQVVGEPRKVGQAQRSLQFRVRQDAGKIMKAIAFNMADRAEELMSQGGQCSLVFVPKRNEWNGMISVDLEVVDFQAGAKASLG